MSQSSAVECRNRGDINNLLKTLKLPLNVTLTSTKLKVSSSSQTVDLQTLWLLLLNRAVEKSSADTISLFYINVTREHFYMRVVYDPMYESLVSEWMHGKSSSSNEDCHWKGQDQQHQSSSWFPNLSWMTQWMDKSVPNPWLALRSRDACYSWHDATHSFSLLKEANLTKSFGCGFHVWLMETLFRNVRGFLIHKKTNPLAKVFGAVRVDADDEKLDRQPFQIWSWELEDSMLHSMYRLEEQASKCQSAVDIPAHCPIALCHSFNNHAGDLKRVERQVIRAVDAPLWHIEVMYRPHEIRFYHQFCGQVFQDCYESLVQGFQQDLELACHLLH